MPVSLRLLLLLTVVLIWILAWQGNLGKGLACIVAPAALEVTIGQPSTTGGTS